MEQTILNVEKDNLPLPRGGHRIVSDEGNIYSIGGYIQFPDSLLVRGEIWRYNLISNRWEQMHFQNLSFHLAASHAVCPLGHTLIIHGGTGTNFGKFIDNSLTVLDLRSLTSYTLSTAPKDNISRNVPLATYGHTLTFATVDGESYLYKVGGAMGATYTMNVYRYSLRHKVWERVYHSGDPTNLHPENRYRHDTIHYKDKLYVIAGGNEIETHPLWPMPVFDLTTNKWSFMEFSGTKPPLFRYQSSVLVDHYVYVVGGITDLNPTINPDIYRLDLEQRVCCLVGKQESPAYFHDVAYIPHLDELYSFGGTFCINPVTRTNQLHRFRLRTRPLELVEVAWDRVLRLLASPQLGLFAIQHYIMTSQTESQNALQSICDRLKSLSHGMNFKLAVAPFNLLSLQTHQPFVLVFHVSAVLLLIMHGSQLGLHDVQSLQTHTDVINALEKVTSGDKNALPNLMKRLSEQLQQTNPPNQSYGDSQFGRISNSSGRNADIPRASLSSDLSLPNTETDTRLPISTALDCLFYTLLLCVLKIPEHLIRRLPDGLEYLHYVLAIERILDNSGSFSSDPVIESSSSKQIYS